MPNEELFYVTANTSATAFDVIEKFKKRKITQEVGGYLSETFKRLEVKLTKDLTAIAYQAARSTVPIHKRLGGTLRNQHIQNNITKINKGNKVGKVWVDDVTHQPPYNFSGSSDIGEQEGRPAASLLAKHLDTGKFRRTRPSDPEPGFSAVLGTTAWTQKANDQYEKVAQEYLASDLPLEPFLDSISSPTVPKHFPAGESEEVISPGKAFLQELNSGGLLGGAFKSQTPPDNFRGK